MLEILKEKNDKEEIVLTVGVKGQKPWNVFKNILADFENISISQVFWKL